MRAGCRSGNVRVVPQLNSEVCILVGELAKNDGTACGGTTPGRQQFGHVPIVAIVSAPCHPIIVRSCRRERSEFAALLFCDGSCKLRWSLAGYAAGATFTSKARVSASVS